jgi:hypothetical protein
MRKVYLTWQVSLLPYVQPNKTGKFKDNNLLLPCCILFLVKMIHFLSKGKVEIQRSKLHLVCMGKNWEWPSILAKNSNFSFSLNILAIKITLNS